MDAVTLPEIVAGLHELRARLGELNGVSSSILGMLIGASINEAMPEEKPPGSLLEGIELLVRSLQLLTSRIEYDLSGISNALGVARSNAPTAVGNSLGSPQATQLQRR